MKLAAWMKIVGLGDDGVAAKLSLSREAVRLLRLGKRNPTHGTMEKVKRMTKSAVMPNDWF